MEALEVEGQTDQPPLTDGGLLPTQGELAEAEHVLDHSNDRFDSAFADAIDGFAHGSLKLVSHLHLVSLLKSGIGGIFHDAGLGVSEVVLVSLAWSWHRWRWWTTTRTLSCLPLPLFPFGYLGIILGLLGCCPLGGASLQHHFG